MYSSSGSRPSLLRALETAEDKHLGHDPGRFTGDRAEDFVGDVDVATAHDVEDLAGLVGRHAVMAQHGARPGTLVGLHTGHVIASLAALGPRGTGTYG